jgi:hypothetical protein
MQDINDYSYISNYISYDDTIKIRVPKVIARIKICGGGLTFTITDNMQFEMPTKEQCENLKKTFGIEVELVNEEIGNNNLVDGKISSHHIDYEDGVLSIIND